jgi:glycosyltransferase involved in cell wall biosynthesis
MVESSIDLSVVICTRNRPDSLAETLRCLLAADRDHLKAEVVVVDNGAGNDAQAVVEGVAGRIPVRYLREEREGKGNSLNRALAAGGLGRIVAGLDDDMSPEPDWFRELMASCDRYPDVDIFGGLVYLIWPLQPVPIWAKRCHGDVLAWGFSATGVRDSPKVDRHLRRDRFPCGNHFWFRSRLLTPASRFGHLWVPEPALFLNFSEQGSKAIITNRVVAGHRIQPALLNPETHYSRAVIIGHNFATDAMRPYRPSQKVPRTFNRHPVLTRVYCLAMMVRFGCVYLASRLLGSRNLWVLRRILAIERITFFRVLLQIASEDEPYWIFRRRRA